MLLSWFLHLQYPFLLLLCPCYTNLHLHLLILSLIFHHLHSSLLLCLGHTKNVILRLYLHVGVGHLNHLIVTGQFITWVKWMWFALTVGLCIG